MLALDLIQENRVLRCSLPLSGSSRKKPKQEPLRSEAFGFDSKHAEIWKHLYDKFESVLPHEIEKTVEPFLLKLRTFLSESEINRVVVLPAGEAVRDAQGRVRVYRLEQFLENEALCNKLFGIEIRSDEVRLE